MIHLPLLLAAIATNDIKKHQFSSYDHLMPTTHEKFPTAVAHATQHITHNTQNSALTMPWQLSQPGGKLGGFERHLLTRVSCHFAFFTTDGRSAVKKSQSCSQPITDRLVLTDMNFEHNVFITDILYQGAVHLAVYCTVRF
jgi:hypothetical protein